MAVQAANVNINTLPPDTRFFTSKNSLKIILAATPSAAYWEYWPPTYRSDLNGWVEWPRGTGHTPEQLINLQYTEISREEAYQFVHPHEHLRVGAGL